MADGAADETRGTPLTLSLSPWERGRPLNGCGVLPLPWGEGRGEGVTSPRDLAAAVAGWLTYLGG